MIFGGNIIFIGTNNVWMKKNDLRGSELESLQKDNRCFKIKNCLLSED